MPTKPTPQELPYKVYDRDGVLKMSAPESLRYPKETELSIINAGYTIKLNGKKITKKEITNEERNTGQGKSAR